MKKIQRIGLVLVLLFAAHSAMAAKLSPVRLVYASPQIRGSVYDQDLYTDINVHVDNMDGQPGSWSVYLRYHTNPGRPWLGPWPTMPMIQAGNYGTHRLYTATVPSANVCFEIIATWRSYSGLPLTETYRDNNDGSYYRVSAFARRPYSPAGAVGGHVGLVTARNFSRIDRSRPGSTLYNQYVEGEIVVPNLVASRIAGIRMTTDNWATSVDVPVSDWHVFSNGDEDLAWGAFDRLVAGRLTKPNKTVKFKVYFRDPVSGQVYWDSNFGQDYTVKAGETLQ
ncbi:MAG: CBM21 domain-containing protein [Verrucomicrobia bacterium]|nr:CBM21 domain-containing protein [Verrucomicrobiota bacterium]